MMSAFNAQSDGFRTRYLYMIMEQNPPPPKKKTYLFGRDLECVWIPSTFALGSRVVHMLGEVVAKFQNVHLPLSPLTS